MKNKIVVLSLSLLTLGMITSSCNWAALKTEKEKVEMEDLNSKKEAFINDQNQTFKDSMLLFKKEAELKITNYEAKIAELKEKNKLEKKKNNTEYEKVLAELEQKNRDMKKRLADFNDTNQQNWSSFKSEFNHDLEKLGNAFKDITVNNVK